MNGIKAVLWDFDGTLADTNQVVLNSWYHTFDHYGMDRPAVEVLTATFGENLEDSLARFFPDHPVEEVVAVFRGYQKNHFKSDVDLYPGVRDVLYALNSKGYKQAIVTSRSKASLRNNGYEFPEPQVFSAYVMAEDTDAHKPDPTPCLIALEKLGVAAEEAIMIGDSRLDTLCGKNAGVKTVLVGWSLACPRDQAVGQYEPDYIIEKAEDLLAILE